MVSRRNYFSITIIMFVIFFLFQFSSVALEVWNDYEENRYAEELGALLPAGEAYQAGQSLSSGLVVYIGGAEDPVWDVARSWAVYGKRDVEAYSSLSQYQAGRAPEMILLSPGGVSWSSEAEIERLRSLADEGIHLIFCGLPEPEAIARSESLQELLGIRAVVSRETEVEGLHLYGGFLLGGEVIYQGETEEENEEKQDLETSFPWYSLSAGTKVYMKGIPADESLDVEEHPPVIWRRTAGAASVFVVNGGYMEDAAGLGLLAAMTAEMDRYALYPGVNAQNLVLANYPGLAAENNEAMMRGYSQSMQGVFRDIVWPELSVAYQRSDLGLSCMMAPQFDYEDDNLPDQAQLQYYMRLMNEQQAEVGLSGVSVSDTPMDRKLAADQAFMEEALPDYRFASLYGGDLEEDALRAALEEELLSAVRTVATEYQGESELVGYLSERVTRQTILTSALDYTYREDFRVRCVETALGYGSTLVDMGRVAYPSGEDGVWNELSMDLSWNLQNYYQKFDAFTGTTLSECDGRIRTFLALDYEESREGDVISLDVTGASGSAWFVLRTRGEAVDHVDGGGWTRLEDGAYLIEAEDAHVYITLKPADAYRYIYG